MSDALRDAELLAHAVLGGTGEAFHAYQTTRDVFAGEFLDLSDEIASFDWDLERIRLLHHRLSKLMAREEDLLRSLDGCRAARRRSSERLPETARDDGPVPPSPPLAPA